MLQSLSIQNYALINALEIKFKSGLTTITGETGAGKSIILGALSLVLGKRSDSAVLRDPEKKCVVEAVFSYDRSSFITDFFKKQDLDLETEIILRREINKEGKSRSFINDTPVKLADLKTIGALLIDIHSQPDNRAIAESGFQLNALDSFASNEKLLAAYVRIFEIYRSKKRELQQLRETELRSKEELDYMMFQFNELDEAGLEEGEHEKLEAESVILEKADGIREGLAEAIQHLTDEDKGSIDGLRKAILSVQSMQDIHTKLKEITERLQSCEIELNDVSLESESLLNEIEVDPGRLDDLQSRLAVLFKLQKKHGKSSVTDLIELRDELGASLASIDSLDDKITDAEVALKKCENELRDAGEKLSISRKKNAAKLEKEIGTVLSQLQMKDAVLKVEFSAGDINYSPTGIDQIQWMFTANKGMNFQELRKVASGGELARLMLSIKTVLTKVMAFPTLIFDEIDTGVSGEVAIRVGRLMKLIAKDTQVLSITHLPQIASQGDQQMLVFKASEKNKTVSGMRELSGEERITEIAKMLSGKTPSAAAIDNAKDLLQTV